MTIDPTLFTVESLLRVFLDDQFGNRDAWRKYASIEQETVPACDVHKSRTIWVVRFGRSYLRYSQGPLQGFSWDVYGDDFQNPALAFKALLEAPVPPGICRPWPPNPDTPVKNG